MQLSSSSKQNPNQTINSRQYAHLNQTHAFGKLNDTDQLALMRNFVVKEDNTSKQVPLPVLDQFTSRVNTSQLSTSQKKDVHKQILSQYCCHLSKQLDNSPTHLFKLLQTIKTNDFEQIVAFITMFCNKMKDQTFLTKAGIKDSSKKPFTNGLNAILKDPIDTKKEMGSKAKQAATKLALLYRSLSNQSPHFLPKELKFFEKQPLQMEQGAQNLLTENPILELIIDSNIFAPSKKDGLKWKPSLKEDDAVKLSKDLIVKLCLFLVKNNKVPINKKGHYAYLTWCLNKIEPQKFDDITSLMKKFEASLSYSTLELGDEFIQFLGDHFKNVIESLMPESTTSTNEDSSLRKKIATIIAEGINDGLIQLNVSDINIEIGTIADPIRQKLQEECRSDIKNLDSACAAETHPNLPDQYKDIHMTPAGPRHEKSKRPSETETLIVSPVPYASSDTESSEDQHSAKRQKQESNESTKSKRDSGTSFEIPIEQAKSTGAAKQPPEETSTFNYGADKNMVVPMPGHREMKELLSKKGTPS